MKPSALAEKTFIINLSHRKDRLASVHKQMAAIGYGPYEIFNAYGVNNLPPERYYRDIPDFKMSGFHGNRFSHYGVIEQAKKEGLKSVMIFEDDVVLHPEFNEIVGKALTQLEPLNWDWLQFGGNYRFHNDAGGEVSPIDGMPYINLKNGLWPRTPNLSKIVKMLTAHAYLVREPVYDFILDNVIKSGQSIDGFYSNEIFRRFECYCVTPCVATQAPGWNDISNAHGDYRPYIGEKNVQPPTPTKRAGIETGWKCNVKCGFCFHIFKDTDKPPIDIEIVKASIVAAKGRGNDTIDLVGPGEPSIVPHIAEVIAFAKGIDMRVCMITNGIIGAKKLNDIIDAGIDDFVISMHGMSETHDHLIGDIKGGRKSQEKTINTIRERGSTYRVNFVINSQNASEVVKFSEYLIGLDPRPRIVSFLNFLPHGEWAGNIRSSEFMANLRELEPLLDRSIDLLESASIAVNVRYYPMCRLSEPHGKNICNDLHVMFDPYEWDYSISPKTVDRYMEHGKLINKTAEEQGGACEKCEIRVCCGGINREFNRMTGGKLIGPIGVANKDHADFDFYAYRQHNLEVFKW